MHFFPLIAACIYIVFNIHTYIIYICIYIYIYIYIYIPFYFAAAHLNPLWVLSLIFAVFLISRGCQKRFLASWSLLSRLWGRGSLYIHVCIYICIYVYLYKHIYVYIHIYTYIVWIKITTFFKRRVSVILWSFSS